MKPVFQWVYSTPTAPQASPASPPAVASDVRPGKGDRIADRIEQAFDTASSTTGTSFEYLVRTAKRESAMNPTAKAKTSSAVGLFQFIESTWLETMKLSGHQYGLGAYADKIVVGNDGRYRVPDPADRKAILDLRKDPDISAMMAGALTQRNAAYLTERLGRDVSQGELYIAHFLGARGAASLIGLAQANPDASAADHFPRQASANKSIFYEKGRPLSVAAVYADLVKTHGGDAPAIIEPTVMTAYADPFLAPPGATPGVEAGSGGTAGRVAAGWQAVGAEDAFTALFRTDRPTAAPVAATAYWQAYAVTPALFDVAVAEDEKLLAAAGLPPATRSGEAASLMARAGFGPGHGPLDLSRFLEADDEEG